MRISRRHFIGSSALAGAAGEASAAPAAGSLPVRTLGRTGARVPLLAYGCGSSFSEYGTFDQALATLTRALDLGISYIDTAALLRRGQERTDCRCLDARTAEPGLAGHQA